MALADQNMASTVTQITSLINTLTLSPNPDVTVGGRTYSKGAYLGILFKALDDAISAQQRLSAPFEVSTGAPYH